MVSPKSGERFSGVVLHWIRCASCDRDGANECRKDSFGAFNKPISRSGSVLTSMIDIEQAGARQTRCDAINSNQHVRHLPIVLQKSQNTVRLIFRYKTKQVASGGRCRFKPVTEVACELVTGSRSPPHQY